MTKSDIHHLGDYEYQIYVYAKGTAGFQGAILITAHEGVPLSPVVEILTPTHFMAQRAAQIEADALAYQLIHTGAIVALLPSSSADVCTG